MRYTPTELKVDVCQMVGFSVHAAGKMMKGPSLRYNTRVLRVFCCDGCGRQVETPGHVTSQTCRCSDPPKFMRPLDRPRTVSPDVSMFISPADPEDLIEVDEIDEVPYVPHVPIKPPPPARFANRRKLYDDSVPQVEPDFGDGLVQGSTNDVPLTDETPAEGIPTQSREKPADESHKPVRDNERSRRGRREQTGEPEATQRPGNNAAPPHRRSDTERRPDASRRPDTTKRSDAAQSESRANAGRASLEAGGKSTDLDRSGVSEDSAHASNDSDAEQTTAEQGDGRRRSRRRGRRRGPRPEGNGA